MSMNAAQVRTGGGSNVRIGPITVFALVIILCMAVLAVLSLSTSNATLTMSQRQATAMTELYLDETAAQEFLADLDARLASGGTGAVEGSLDAMCDQVEASSGGQVHATAAMEGERLDAEFTCENGRTLKVSLTIRDDLGFRIDKWKMTAVVNEEEPAGNLWTGM